jgi:PEP-CTERM motif
MPQDQTGHRCIAVLTLLGGLLVFESLAPDPDLPFPPPDPAGPHLSVEVMPPSPASEPTTATATELPPAALVHEAAPVSTTLEPQSSLAAAAQIAAEASAPEDPTAEASSDYTAPPLSLYAGMPQLRGLSSGPEYAPYTQPAVRVAESTSAVEAPEPETLVLMALALLAVAARRRRT